jgi:phosphoglycolate phosphatase
MEKNKLVLFDIDGTLLTSNGAGEHALRLAVRELFGAEDDLADIEIAGRTDSGIARAILAKHGVTCSAENLARFYEVYLRHLERELPNKKGGLLPGILELLEALRARENIALGLLTGNLSRGAEIKLTHYGLSHFFDFGAYADDHHERPQLGSFARERARERHGTEFSADNIYVIGDTPHDIECGRSFGARTIAIATGRYSRAELAEHKPDFLFDDLSDVRAVLAALDR